MEKIIRNFMTKCKCIGRMESQFAVDYVDIPEGRHVLFDKLQTNSGSVWARVHWRGRAYYVHPDNLVIKTREVIKKDSPKPGLMAYYKQEDIQLIGQIPLWDENLQAIASHLWLAIDSINNIVQIQESECEYFYEMSDEFEEKICWDTLDPSHYYFERIEK